MTQGVAGLPGSCSVLGQSRSWILFQNWFSWVSGGLTGLLDSGWLQFAAR